MSFKIGNVFLERNVFSVDIFLRIFDGVDIIVVKRWSFLLFVVLAPDFRLACAASPSSLRTKLEILNENFCSVLLTLV